MIDLGYGFVSGINRINKKRVCSWLHTSEDITWKAFIWYLSEYFEICEFGDDWLTTKIVSTKQRKFFYDIVIQYKESVCVQNYINDCENELWKTHKRGIKSNYGVWCKLVENI